MDGVKRAATLTHRIWLQKIRSRTEMIKISVTNIEFYTRNYLMFTNNPGKKVSNLKLFFGNLLKNEEKKVYSTFATVTLKVSLLLSTVHSTISPAFMFNICAIGAGSVVLTELLLVVPLLIFVFCLNTITISSFIFVVIFIYGVRGI